MSTKSNAVSVRLDANLQPTVKKWLKQHPDISMSRLINMAVRGFVSNDQVLKAVETSHATKKEASASLKKMMKTHKKTLDELK